MTSFANVPNLTNVTKFTMLANVNMNVAKFPEDLAKQLRVMAAERGVKIRELVIEACRNLVNSGTQPLQKMPCDPSLQDRLMKLSAPQTSRSPKKKSVSLASPAGSAIIGTEERGMQGDGVDRCSHRMNSVCDDCKKIRSGK